MDPCSLAFRLANAEARLASMRRFCSSLTSIYTHIPATGPLLILNFYLRAAHSSSFSLQVENRFPKSESSHRKKHMSNP